jgi:hypothetical protein
MVKQIGSLIVNSENLELKLTDYLCVLLCLAAFNNLKAPGLYACYPTPQPKH